MSHVALCDPIVQGSEDLIECYCVDSYLDQSQRGRLVIDVVDLVSVHGLELAVWRKEGEAWVEILQPGEGEEPDSRLQLVPDPERPGYASVVLPATMFTGEPGYVGPIKLRVRWLDANGRVHWSDALYEEVVEP